MKGNTMRTASKTMYLAICGCLIAVVLTSATCKSFDPGARKEKQKPVKVTRSAIQPDSAVVERLGDTVCSLMFNPRAANLYLVNPLERPADHNFTIGGYKVEQHVATLQPDYLSTLLFLMADSASYNDSPMIPAVAFMPEVALEIPGKDETLSVIFSFISQQMAIVRNGAVQKTIRYNNTRLFLLFFNNILHNDLYNKQLNTPGK